MIRQMPYPHDLYSLCAFYLGVSRVLLDLSHAERVRPDAAAAQLARNAKPSIFQMKQEIPFSAGWMRSKWDFLLHLEYGDGDRVRTRARLTKKARGSRSGLSRVKGGPSGVRTLGLGIKSPLLCQLS